MRISNIIVCDDIREETGGKYTLVGVYSNKIVFENNQKKELFPVSKQLGVFIKFVREKNTTSYTKFEMRLFLDSPGKKPSDEIIVSGMAVKEIDFSKPLVISFVAPFNFQSQGTLKLEMKFKAEDGQDFELSSDLVKITERQSNPSEPNHPFSHLITNPPDSSSRP